MGKPFQVVHNNVSPTASIQDKDYSLRTEELSRLSGESVKTLQLFTAIHRSEHFTEAAAFKFFVGITKNK